jgi:hypothetical protein
MEPYYKDSVINKRKALIEIFEKRAHLSMTKILLIQ